VLAENLVRDGLLTPFQAERLLCGKWRNFILSGKYKVLKPLGWGGMADVCLCEHLVMRRRVAVKVLPSRSSDPVALERFRREARAVARLRHPNIVAAYDIDHDGELHFLVMEYIDGRNLRTFINQRGRIDPLWAAHYIRQAALGLQHAHEAGLVHRDIKPSNLLLDRTGTVKILDLGLARFFHDESDDLSRLGAPGPVGTSDYMAPEQAVNSHQVDIRADVYGLGATFYFLLAGWSPSRQGTARRKRISHQLDQPSPIREIRPEIPEGLAAVLDRMLAREPGERYQTPAEVAEALAPWTQTPLPAPPAELLEPDQAGAGTGHEEAVAASSSSLFDPAPLARGLARGGGRYHPIAGRRSTHAPPGGWCRSACRHRRRSGHATCGVGAAAADRHALGRGPRGIPSRTQALAGGGRELVATALAGKKSP
jgi:serine/threonine protein kinase